MQFTIRFDSWVKIICDTIPILGAMIMNIMAIAILFALVAHVL